MPPLQKPIDSLGRVFKTDLRYSLSGGLFLTLIQISSALLGFLLTIAFANLLPVETYGTYRYILAAYSLFAIVALPGLDTSLIQSISRGKEGAYKESVSARMRWGIIGTILSVLYATYLWSEGSTIVALLFLVLGLSLPLMEGFSMYSAFLNGKKLFKPWAIAEIATQIFSVAVLIGTMFFTKNIVLLIAAYFIPYIIARGCASWYTMRVYVQNADLDDDSLAYGKSMTLFQIIARLMTSIDQIVLYFLLGPAQVAMFALATAIPNRLQGLYRATGILAFPKFATRTSQEVTNGLFTKMFLFLIGIVVVCILYALAAPLIFTYLFPQYVPAITYSQIAVFYTISAMTYPFGAYLMAHKKVKENYTIALSSFGVKALSLAIFVPLIGIWGAVIGLIASSLTTIGLVLWMLHREPKISLQQQ